MAKVHTHYDNLKVARNAPPEVIRAAYRVLTQKYHPDKNAGSKDATRVTSLVNEAYDVLMDPAKRAEHDAWIAQQEDGEEGDFRAATSASAPAAAPSRREPAAEAAEESPRNSKEAKRGGAAQTGRHSGDARHDEAPSSADAGSAGKSKGSSVAWWTALIIAVVVLRYIFGAGTSSAPPITPPAPAEVVSSLEPDSNAVLRDLLGTKRSAGTAPEIWATVDFTYQGLPHVVSFVALKPLDEKGNLQDCHACEPRLASVTYRKEANGWTLAAVDENVGSFGSWGKPPEKVDFVKLPFRNSAALAFEDTDGGQGYTQVSRGILRFDGDWALLGYVPVGADNKGTAECEEDQSKCWSWRGDLNVSDKTSSGVPDLVINRRGTVSEDGAVIAATKVTYAYSPKGYEEKKGDK